MSSPPPYPPPPGYPPQTGYSQPGIPTGPDGRPARPPMVTVIAVTDFLAGGFFGLLTILFLVVTIGASGPDAFEQRLGGTICSLIVGLLAVGCIAAGVGVLRMSGWGRVMQFVVSSVGLLFCGIGTIVNALILVYMASRRTSILFSGRRAAELTPDELMHVNKPPSANPAVILVAVVVGIFVVIGMIGIVAAIAIPNLLTAVDRGKQKRTMADERTISSAVEAYAIDYNAYPQDASAAGLAAALVPTYASSVPVNDGWGHPFEVTTGASGYVIRSAGKDGTYEQQDPWSYEPGQVTDFKGDIVCSNGKFIRTPDADAAAPTSTTP